MPMAMISSSQIVTLFACAGLVLYLAARGAVDALIDPADPSPMRMALAHWMPIAWSALLATLAGHGEVGVSLALATSVASMGLVLGVLLCVAPEGMAIELRCAGAWPFVLPAALLVFLAGFSGSLNWIHALMLLGLGVCVAAVWRCGSDADETAPLAGVSRRPRALPPGAGFEVTIVPPTAATPAIESAPAVATVDPPPPGNASSRPRRYWRGQLILAIALGAIGGWMGYQGIILAAQRAPFATSGLIAMGVLSPLLVLSLLGTGSAAAQSHRFGSVVAAIVAMILLNLCLLLPLITLAQYARRLVIAWYTGPHTWAALLAAWHPMPFPIGAWRIDTVLLIVLGVMLLPVSLGRWKLGKVEGLGLAILYAAYLIASTAVAIRL